MHIKQINMQLKNWINRVSFRGATQWRRGNLLAIFLIPTFFLTACTTAGNAISQGGPSMSQVYEQAMGESNAGTLDQARQQINSSINYNGATQLSDFTRTQENEINNLFPLLPNPQLVMYIYPHLAGTDEAPVPGYSTVFTFYEKEHYALQGA